MDSNVPSCDEIRRKTIEVFGYRPCLWQVIVAEAILKNQQDIVCTAGTGTGKTLTFWIPLLFRKQGIQLIVTALNILGKQNVEQLKLLNISGIAISAETATLENFKVSKTYFSRRRLR